MVQALTFRRVQMIRGIGNRVATLCAAELERVAEVALDRRA